MKQCSVFLVIIAFCLASFFEVGCEKKTNIQGEQLPEQALLFIGYQFGRQPISSIIKVKKGRYLTYEVILRSGIDIDFDYTGKVVRMNGHGNRLPPASILARIVNYLGLNYSGYYISEWELEFYGQKIKLSNGIELAFDIEGNFISILK